LQLVYSIVAFNEGKISIFKRKKNASKDAFF